MINRQELNKIKEKIERKKDEPCYGNIFIDERNTTFEQDNERLLEIIQSAEEFGAVDGRRKRQEANTTALRKVLTDCGMNIPIEYGFDDMLYRLKIAMGHNQDEPKVLDADGVEIKPGDELYYITNAFLAGKKTPITESVHAEKNPGGGNEPWVQFHSGWEYAHLLTHQKPETLQDLISDLDKGYEEYWGCTDYGCEDCPAKIDGKTPDDYYDKCGCKTAMYKDISRRLEAIAKRMGGDE